MLRSIKFSNFKALRNCKLPLAPFTLIMGPNGSGKSTALFGLKMACGSAGTSAPLETIATAGADLSSEWPVQVTLEWDEPFPGAESAASWSRQGKLQRVNSPGPNYTGELPLSNEEVEKKLATVRVFSLDAKAIARPVTIQPNIDLGDNGENFAALLDWLRDSEPERYDALKNELTRWLPEYDNINYDVVSQGQKVFLLRTREGRHKIPATQLSQGTLLSFAMLALAYLPNPPAIIGLEEPDRGIHPRLLRELRDALYRLSYPESFGETREPVQVIATSHSPYLLDLYRDHPEEVVLAEKSALDVQFRRLSDTPHFEEILGDAPLSEVWYSGIFGGVPVSP